MGNIVHTVRSNKINLTGNVEYILQCIRHGKVVLICQVTQPQVSSLLVRSAAFIETLVELSQKAKAALYSSNTGTAAAGGFFLELSIAQNGLLLDTGIKIIELHEY